MICVIATHLKLPTLTIMGTWSTLAAHFSDTSWYTISVCVCAPNR